MNDYEAVLFDMDGVVIDTHQSVTDFWLAFAAEHNVSLTPDDFDDHIYGVPVAHTLGTLFPDLSPDEYPAVRERTNIYELGLRYLEVRGLTAFLHSLKAVRVATALVTSGEVWKVDEMTRQLGLAGQFDALVTAKDVRQGKPDPECYALAAMRLGTPSSRCIVFEDSISGVRAAVDAGSLCIGVQIGRLAQRLIEGGAWQVLPDFSTIQLAEGWRHDDSPGHLTLRLDDDHALTLKGRQA